MNSKDKAKKSKRFIFLYYNIMWDLGLEIDEYVVLNTMYHYRKRSKYKKGIMFLSETLSFSRGKIYGCVQKLYNKGFLNKEGLNYHLSPELMEHFSNPEGNYSIIFKDWKSIEPSEIKHYLLLYQIYSIGLKTKNNIAFIGKKHFNKHCSLKNRNLFKTLEKMQKNKTIIKMGLNSYKLSDSAFNWFEKRRCSNSS